jgi:hypothetical protein
MLALAASAMIAYPHVFLGNRVVVTTWNAALGVGERVLGLAIVGSALIDVFYTVLFPGSGHGPIRRNLARALRTVFRVTNRLPSRLSGPLLSYAGPIEVTATLLSWFALLLLGWAAIYWPALGRGIAAAEGATDQSWATAVYFSGYNLTTLGLGDLVATSPAYRVLVVLEAATGFMVFTLAISYFVSVYSTLISRNTFARALHDRSRGTGRGWLVACALWEEGPVAAALHLDAMAAGLRQVAQTHSSYPVLQAFHYNHDFDALPRMLEVCLETTTLLRTTIDVRNPPRPELCGSALTEIDSAAEAIIESVGAVGSDARPTADELAAWRSHHREVTDALATAVVPVLPYSVDDYLDARSRWDGPLRSLARALLYTRPAAP